MIGVVNFGDFPAEAISLKLRGSPVNRKKKNVPLWLHITVENGHSCGSSFRISNVDLIFSSFIAIETIEWVSPACKSNNCLSPASQSTTFSWLWEIMEGVLMPNHCNKVHVFKVTLFHHWMSEFCAAPALQNPRKYAKHSWIPGWGVLPYKDNHVSIRPVHTYLWCFCCCMIGVVQWDLPQSNLGSWLMQYFVWNKVTPMQLSQSQWRFPHHLHIIASWQTTKAMILKPPLILQNCKQ